MRAHLDGAEAAPAAGDGVHEGLEDAIEGEQEDEGAVRAQGHGRSRLRPAFPVRQPQRRVGVRWPKRHRQQPCSRLLGIPCTTWSLASSERALLKRSWRGHASKGNIREFLPRQAVRAPTFRLKCLQGTDKSAFCARGNGLARPMCSGFSRKGDCNGNMMRRRA